MRRIATAGLALALGLMAQTAAACGVETDCVLEVGGKERTYRIRMPEAPSSGKIGAILYHHGYRGSAKGAMGHKGMAELAAQLGVALIAAKSDGDDWQIANMPGHSRVDGSDALAYTDAVLADVTERFAIDPDRIMATGFSAGGMMVWTLACHRSESFAGFAPIAGTFWAPVPESCSSPPASIVHIHGSADKIVPLAGRPIANTHQGAIADAMALYIRHGAFTLLSSQAFGELDCTLLANADGDVLEMCLHTGGHSFKASYIAHAWSRLMDAGKL